MSQQLQNYLVDIIEEVHHYYVFKDKDKRAAIDNAKHRFAVAGDEGITIHNDNLKVIQCLDLSKIHEL